MIEVLTATDTNIIKFNQWAVSTQGVGKCLTVFASCTIQIKAFLLNEIKKQIEARKGAVDWWRRRTLLNLQALDLVLYFTKLTSPRSSPVLY